MGGARNRKKDENPSKTTKERLATLETDMGWVKEALGKIDRRTWWILGSVVALGLVAIAISIIGATLP